MAFIEEQFPTSVQYGAESGIQYNNQLITNYSGNEYISNIWTQAKHRFNVQYIDTIDDLYTILEFFYAAKGKLNGFRLKNKLDYKSCGPTETISFTDQTLGTGDGNETDFQLKKTYTKVGLSTEYTVIKPVSGTVVISIDDVEQSSGWSVDTTTGIVTFSSAPSLGEVVKAGFEYDIPVRFDVDSIPITLESINHGATTISLVEL